MTQYKVTCDNCGKDISSNPIRINSDLGFMSGCCANGRPVMVPLHLDFCSDCYEKFRVHSKIWIEQAETK